MTIRLTWTGPAGADTWTGPLPIVIGREGDVPVDERELSRRHARLHDVDGRLVLTDLGSRNGSFVGGDRVRTADLGPGGRFRLGRVTFTAAVDDAPSEAETRPPEPDETVAVEARPPDEASASRPPDVPPALVVRWTHTETGESGEARVEAPATVGSRADADLVLSDRRVSRRHATLSVERAGREARVRVTDEDSSNGTFVRGERVASGDLGAGGEVRVGPYRLDVVLEGVALPRDRTVSDVGRAGDSREAAVDDDGEASIFFDAGGRLSSRPPEPPRRAFPPALFDAPTVSASSLRADGRPVLEADYLAVGGGIGSFVWVDYLRVSGVPVEAIAVLGLEEKPHSRYERLCVNSQIPDHERLRSDSGSCPDCLWGWPGYAVREAWAEMARGNFGTARTAVWKIFNEPTFATTYTPRSGEVFRSMDVEARRIGWDRMRRPARVQGIRRTDDGRYAVAYTVPASEPDRERYALARFVHVAVGYPGIRLLPDLQAYRQSTGDFEKVVNAYEEHEHVYRHLGARGGTVVLRGWGIVASRIIQRVFELRRDQNADVRILHLTRSIVSEGNRYRGAQRETDNNWEFQPFNWPKACWGGDLRFELEAAGASRRAELLKAWGGTTTADREDWRQIVAGGRSDGWYVIREGEVERVEPGPDGAVRTVVEARQFFEDQVALDADFILDCTGLVSTIDSHPLLKDLVEHHGLGRNVQGRLDVADDFEIRGMRNGQRGTGRMYASGVATLGGPYAPVDSFLGLQYAAQRSVDAMQRARAPRLRHLTAGRSFRQWLRWARGRTPEGRRPDDPRRSPAPRSSR